MIKVLNLVDDSKPSGWIVDIDNSGEKPAHTLKLSGVDSNVSILIDPDDYKELTVPQAINPRVPSKLSIFRNGDEVRPMLKLATPEEDTTISFLNYETQVGETVVAISLNNCIAIDCEVKEENFKSRVTIAVVGVDSSLATEVHIQYGLLGGRSLTTQTIRFAPASRPSVAAQLFTDTVRVESIQPTEIFVPTINFADYES
jgi:hypothetical protein